MSTTAWLITMYAVVTVIVGMVAMTETDFFANKREILRTGGRWMLVWPLLPVAFLYYGILNIYEKIKEKLKKVTNGKR